MGLDIRLPIGLMFTLIGAMLAIYGFVTHSDAELYTPLPRHQCQPPLGVGAAGLRHHHADPVLARPQVRPVRVRRRRKADVASCNGSRDALSPVASDALFSIGFLLT